MPPKHLHFRSEARAKVLRGAATLADALRIALGPRSKSYDDALAVERMRVNYAISFADELLLSEVTLTEVPEPARHAAGVESIEP